MTDPVTLRLDASEAKVEAATVKALRWLAKHSLAALEQSGWDESVLDLRWPEWDAKVADLLEPVIARTYQAALDDGIEALTAAGLIEAMTNAARYLAVTHNRMVGIGDDVFGLIRLALGEGRDQGESIPKLAARVEATLREQGAATWRNRGRTVARTEVIGAHNAGHHEAAVRMTGDLGESPATVVKQWSATLDTRVRETHAEADGQQVMGLNEPFTIGGAPMQYPGDPAGPPAEVINCRCTVEYMYPGDPGYPLTAGGTMTAAPAEPVTAQEEDEEQPSHDGALLVALPAADDPCNGIGPEEKHVTLTWFGTGEEAPDLDTGAIQAAVDAAAATLPALFANDVEGVGSLGDDGARVWMLAPLPISDLRDALLAIPEVGDAVAAVEQYPSFTPHSTIGYPAEGAEELDPDTEAAAADVSAITYDRIALWVGDSRPKEWTLPTEEEPVSETPTDQEALAPPAALRSYADATGPQASEMGTDGEPWHSIFAPEGIVSGDQREFGEESLTWRDLPLPLMYQEATAIGHDGAVRVGRIDTLERDDTTYAKPMIRATGVWDTSETAIEARRQVEARMLRGVSVDADDYAAELVDGQGNPVDMEDLFFGDPADLAQIVERATAARICGATLVSIPAFHQAYIANGPFDPAAEEPGQNEVAADAAAGDAPPEQPADEEAPVPADAEEGDEEVAASAWTLVASASTALEALPSHALFERPPMLDDGITALTIEGDHIYGHLAEWGVCHIGREGICVVPPHSSSGYLYYATGVLDTDAGPVPVGQITMDTGHAEHSLRWRPAAAHYDNTGCAVADIVVGEDEVGIWYSGMIRPDADPVKVRNLKASGALSGDWRDTGGPDLELVAALGVNVPGFPIPRLGLAASAGRQTSLVASGIIGPNTPAQRLGQGVDVASMVRSEVRATLAREARRARLRRRMGRDLASRHAAVVAAMRKES